jgi:Ca-activated chloride channel family protein
MRGWKLGSLLVAGTATLSFLGAADAQEVVSPESRAAPLARHAHVVVPQSRGFVLDRRGDAVVVESVRAHVTLRDAAATTVLDVALRNPGARVAEAVMLLPVPAGAAVGAFDFQGAGAEPSARLLPAAEARRLYDDIVRRARDPALLEFAGHALVRSSVFPVEPGGSQRVRLTYEHVVPVDGPRLDYLLPRSEALDVRIPWDVTVEIGGSASIATAYSPTHGVELERLGDTRMRVKVRADARTEPGPFRLSVLREQKGVTGSLFAYPDPVAGGGTFLFLAGVPTPTGDDAVQVQRQVTLALDRSGSMAGPKIDQARAAALQVIEGLEDGERFNVVDYGTTVSRFAAQPVVKSRESVLQARAYLDALRPTGGTNLHDALVEALRQPVAEGSLPIVLFLTDGLPTVGQRSEAAIAKVVDAHGEDAPRVFTFGVGNDVNAPLLDRIADRTRAVATYVRPNEDVELAVDRVYRRLAGPILAAPRLEALDGGGAVATRRVYDVIPTRMPDVFDGDHVVVLGKYRGTGTLRLRLTGVQAGERRAHDFSFDLAGATTAHAFVPRLWAARRIAYLADEIRQAAAERPDAPPSQELTDEIVRLSTEYGILTEYTSFLATEGTDLSAWGDLVAACSAELGHRAVGTRSGASAVAQGVNFNDRKWQGALNGSNRYVDEHLNTVSFRDVRQAADRSFFKRGRTWIDGSLAGEAAPEEPDRVIEYGSDEHLELVHALVLENRQAVLSLRGDIVLRVGGRTILVRNPDDC